VRTGLQFEDWDWAAHGPSAAVRGWVEAELSVGVKPLFTINNNVNIGTDKEVSGAVDLILGAIDEWGEDTAAFMLSNEPGNFAWRNHYGGTYFGGAWVERYALFAEAVAEAVKAKHPGAFLVNAVQVEQMAMAQFQIAKPEVDALCVHHYTFKHGLPPEYNPRTLDPKLKTFATSDSEFERSMSDYLRQGQLVLDNPDLQLWMTETGIPSASGRTFEPDSLESMSTTQQAKTIARMLMMGFTSVAKTFVYALADQGHDPKQDIDNYGLVTDAIQPKPAYFAMARISALTGGRATPDPDFLAVPVQTDLRSLPLYVNRIGAQDTLVAERIHAERFTVDDGSGMLALWSSAPPRDEFAARPMTFAVNTPLAKRQILVDPLTGESKFVPVRTEAGGIQVFDVAVRDYPMLLVDAVGV
jgi:hypothetical protein